MVQLDPAAVHLQASLLDCGLYLGLLERYPP